MSRVSRVIALSLLVAGISLAAAHLKSFSYDDRRPLDLVIQGLRLDVDSDRRLAITLDVANRGSDVSPPLLLYVHLVALQHTDWLAPLGPGEEQMWSWLSPPLVPGDYEVVASVEHRGGAFDADESNNVARALLHVPMPSARDRALAGPMTRVPSVVGLDRRAALRQLREAGLAEGRWYEHAKGSAIDRVDLQWPEAGTRVPTGTQPVLVAAAARTVPNLVGVEFDQARDRLKRSGLVPGELRVERSMHYTNRSVLAQEPEPGSRIDVASAVGLVVSDPRPSWPFVTAGLMCLLALLLSLSGRVHRSRVSRDDVWVAEPIARLPEKAVAAVADSPRDVTVLAESEPLFHSSDAATIEPPADERPEHRPTVLESPPRPSLNPAIASPTTHLAIEDLRFVHTQGEGRQDVTWQPDDPATTVAFRGIRDPGNHEVRWHPHDRSTI